MGMNQNAFMIGLPVAVTPQSFYGAIENGAAALRWSTILEQNVDGFNMLRSERETGAYERVNASLISTKGASGGAYDFRATTITLNREYYYELEQVGGSGAKVAFGPYKLFARAPFSLARNVPNPFNPTTVIRFTVPEDDFVRLAVYDASGRRVRTLVDGRLRADFYKVQWDGKNDAGRQVSSGVYFYRIQTGRHTQAKKTLLLR
jgi:hypothetical protein